MRVISTKRRRDRVLARVVPLVTRFGLLVLSAISVYTIWLVLQGNEVTAGDAIDDRLLIAMGIAFALAAVVMLLFTPAWSLRAVGQFWTYVGDALLWGGVGASRVHWHHAITPGELQVIRAVFIVGSAALILGIIWWLVSPWVTRLVRWAWQRLRRRHRAPANSRSH